MTDKEYKYDVTVGMPVYGVEKYIRKCLLSVLDQTFQGTMEVLAVDDLGPDRSVDIIRELQQSHPRGSAIRIVTQPRNMGCWAARNRVLDEARGRYVFLLDSDDYLSTDCIEKLYREAVAHDAEAVYGSVATVGEDGQPLQTDQTYLSQPYMVFDGEDALASFANRELHPTLRDFVWNILISHDFISRHGLRFKQARFCDDLICSADMTPLVRRAVLIADPTYYYVIRPGSLSSYQYRDSIRLDEIQEVFRIYGYLKCKCLELQSKPYFETRCTKGMILMFYVVCGALKKRQFITPTLTAAAVRDAMRHPLALRRILRFRRYRAVNLAFWLIGRLPPSLSVWAVTLAGRRKHYL